MVAVTAEAEVKLILPVVLVNANPVPKLVSHADPDPVMINVEEPIANVLDDPELEVNVPQDTDMPLRSSVPVVSVIVCVLTTDKASSNFQDPPTPLKVIGLFTVKPADVIVRTVALVDLKFQTPEPVNEPRPEPSVKLP